jgi:XapX domain-containing protein
MNGEVLLIIIVGIVYLALNLLPPTPPHIIGLVPTVTTLTGYHATRHKAKAR